MLRGLCRRNLNGKVRIKVVGGGPTARSQSLVREFLVVMGYSEGLVFLFEF